MLCESISLSHICQQCQTTLLRPSLYKRQLPNGIEVISFYTYNDIKSLLHTKHSDLGYYIYKILAELSFAKFAKEFSFNEKIVSIGVDDNTRSGYSHTALLNHALLSDNIQPLYKKLRSQSKLSYSGKSLEYRLQHPRNFKVNRFKEQNVILVDDIITTGTTLIQAIHSMKSKGKNILFCLTLADAKL